MIDRMHDQFEVELMQALTRAAPDFAALDAQQQAAAAAEGGGAAEEPQQHAPPVQRSNTTLSSRRTAWARQRSAALFHLIHQQLGQAELLVLPPDAAVTQQTTVLMLAGSLQCAPTMPESGGEEGRQQPSVDSTRDAIRWLCSAGRHKNQGLLPAMWEVLHAEDLAVAPAHVPSRQPRVTLTAGPKGATLLVCPSAAAYAPPQRPTATILATAGSAAAPPPTPGAAASGAIPPRPEALPLPAGRAGSAGPLRPGTGLVHSSSSLDLMTMMPPLAGLSQMGGGQGAPTPSGSLNAPPPGTPAAAMRRQVSGEPAAGSGTPLQQPVFDVLPPGVTRITEEEAPRVTGDSVCAGDAAGASPAGGGSRRFLLQPLDSRRALTREKRLPFTGASGGGGGGAGGGVGGK